jgi:hypothetical protein
MMDRTETFLVWANPDSPWSAWVKPVLFAFEYDHPSVALPAPTSDPSWLPSGGTGDGARRRPAGREGVVVGMALARRGYRPIPLYNALPAPFDGGRGHRIAVDVLPIVAQLMAATNTLRALPLAADAPPAFLLDANRRRARSNLEVGDFDNRSVCFPTDFPSAERLRESGIQRVIVIERGDGPDVDLARVLAAWEAGGNHAAAPRPCAGRRAGAAARAGATLVAVALVRGHGHARTAALVARRVRGHRAGVRGIVANGYRQSFLPRQQAVGRSPD